MGEQAEAPRRVVLSPDYAAESPLWPEGGHAAEDLDLSHPLTARLDRWNELFQQHFHHEHGWTDPAARARFVEEGPRLVRDLQRELPGVDVEFVDWTSPAYSAHERRRRRRSGSEL